jgi:hypothetical protein
MLAGMTGKKKRKVTGTVEVAAEPASEVAIQMS